MKELTRPGLLIAKAVLFVIAGVASAALLLAAMPGWRTLLLLAIVIWSFSRAYCFAFYVVERYIDPSYRFSGLGSAIAHLWRRRLR